MQPRTRVRHQHPPGVGEHTAGSTGGSDCGSGICVSPRCPVMQTLLVPPLESSVVPVSTCTLSPGQLPSSVPGPPLELANAAHQGATSVSSKHGQRGWEASCVWCICGTSSPASQQGLHWDFPDRWHRKAHTLRSVSCSQSTAPGIGSIFLVWVNTVMRT